MKFRPQRAHLAYSVIVAVTSAATLLSASRSQAAAIINVGSHVLLGNQANQTFAVPISGTDQVAGEDFYAQIGDGGTFNGGTASHPIFQKVDVLTGTIFALNNVGATGDPKGTPVGSNAGHPLIWLDGTQTNTGAVNDTGLFATFTIDTTGVTSGTYALALTGVASKFGTFNTTLRDQQGAVVPLTITNGSITVVTPEPASLSLLLGAGLLVGGRRRRTAKK